MAPGKYLILGAGLLASVIADGISFSEWPASLTAGQSVTLKWVGGTDAPATITLRKGASTDLQDVEVLTDNAANGEFSWTPPADLQNSNDYAFQISQGDDVNYTALLPLTGGSDSPTPDDETQQEEKDAASATDGSATSTGAEGAAVTASAESASVTGAAASAESTTAGATSGATSTQSRTESNTAQLEPTVTATPSKMNTPFVGSKKASSTASASSSAQSGSAGHIVAGLSLAALAGSIASLLLLQ